MDELTRKVLNSFAHWRKETLDLHELFEAGGNDPEARTAVFDIVERLVREGLLNEEGNDFYSLTEKGKQARNEVPQRRKDAKDSESASPLRCAFSCVFAPLRELHLL